MELNQAPHEKLTEEEIKDILNEINQTKNDFHERMQINLGVYEDFMDDRINRLLKHFCPEQFKTITMKEMTNLMKEAYGEFKLPGPSPTGSILKMRKDLIE